MSRNLPVSTEVGILRGRDAIFLDSFEMSTPLDSLILRGSINGALCSITRDGFIPYSLAFTGVLAIKMLELDSWDYSSESSFDEIQQSDWIRSLGGKVTSDYRHFLVQTYDYVFEVVCQSFSFYIHPNEA